MLVIFCSVLEYVYTRCSHCNYSSVLEYVYNLEAVENQTQWMKSHMAAVGLSSSKLVLYKNGHENELLSRRVSFRVITNADIKIKQILELDQ